MKKNYETQIKTENEPILREKRQRVAKNDINEDIKKKKKTEEKSNIETSFDWQEKSKKEKKIKSIKKLSNTKPIEIICPAISPLPTMNMFQFPMTPLTPSTTPSILSTKFNSNYFNFPDDFSMIEGNIIKNETDTEVFKSEQNTPRYFLPHFSPKTTFQHYFTPRNSNL